MKIYLYVGMGGAVGSLLRYFVSMASLRLFGEGFPAGTLTVNLVGAFFLGWFMSRLPSFKKLPAHLSAAITTGVIGSFTTLSTLSVDVVTLLEAGFLLKSLYYIGFSVLGGVLLAYAGLNLGRKNGEGGK